jgi:hypothetical protein
MITIRDKIRGCGVGALPKLIPGLKGRRPFKKAVGEMLFNRISRPVDNFVWSNSQGPANRALSSCFPVPPSPVPIEEKK